MKVLRFLLYQFWHCLISDCIIIFTNKPVCNFHSPITSSIETRLFDFIVLKAKFNYIGCSCGKVWYNILDPKSTESSIIKHLEGRNERD